MNAKQLALSDPEFDLFADDLDIDALSVEHLPDVNAAGLSSFACFACFGSFSSSTKGSSSSFSSRV